jgi:gamma-glutamylcyclotransferase (GGCT)/AIG2-like uncharacterized protein YtfP
MLNTRNPVQEVNKKIKPIFVYGTLRQEAEDQTLWYLPGYQMRDTGRFPYIEYTGRVSDVVVGQLLEVPDTAALAALDRYENVAGGLYTREDVTVRNRAGDSEQERPTNKRVQAYIKGPAFDYPVVKSGDWNQYTSSNKEKSRG